MKKQMKRNLLLAIAWFILAGAITIFFMHELKVYMRYGDMSFGIINGRIGSALREVSVLKELSFKTDEIASIDASVQNYDIQFTPADTDTLTVKIIGRESNEMLPEFHAENNCLYIAAKEWTKRYFHFFGFYDNNSYKIVISIPRPLTVHITGTSSDIAIAAVTLKSLYAKTVSGDIRLTNTKIENEMQIITISGDIRGSADCPKYAVQTTSGDWRMKCLASPRAGIMYQAVSGDCTLYLPKNIGGFKTTFNSVSGDYINQFTGTKGERITSDMYLDGSITLFIKTTSGDCRIKKL